MSRLIYLAGPLDGLTYDGTAWYEGFGQLCSSQQVGFMPGRAYVGAITHCPDVIDAANRTVIGQAAAVLANLSGAGRALGTIREIEFAKSIRKPVVVVGDVRTSLAAHDLVVAPDLEAAMRRLPP